MGRYLDSPWARPISLSDAISLVARVRESAERGARHGLEALASVLPMPIVAITLRACPELPPSIEERIADNHAQTMADSVMYREALASAARERGWAVRWYDRDRVLGQAATARGVEDIQPLLNALGRRLGPPWQAKHKLAAAAAIAAWCEPSRPASPFAPCR